MPALGDGADVPDHWNASVEIENLRKVFILKSGWGRSRVEKEVVAVDQSRRLTVKYKDGEKIIIVPQSAPIVTFEPGDRAMVKPGAHVIVTAARQSDGTLSASRILVGRDGLVPPM